MGDPLSVTAGIVGLLSAGIEVSCSLVEFYKVYRGQNAAIERTSRKLEGLVEIFKSIQNALNQGTFPKDDVTLVKTIQDSIGDCEETIHELKQMLQIFHQPSAGGFRATLKATSRRATYPFRQTTLQALDDHISDIRQSLSLSLQALQLRDSNQTHVDNNEIIALVSLVRADQVVKSICDWLKAPDATVNHHEACNKKHPATGLWLVQGPQFLNWLDQDASFLWINGFAGCGKSVICSTVIQYAFRYRRSDPHIGIAFFYFSFNDASKQDASGMIRSLLLQLSSQLSDGYADLTRLHQSHSHGTPPIQALLGTLREVIQKFQDVYLFLDALDEAPELTTRENVLQAVEDIKGWSIRGLHLFITSRDIPDIRRNLEVFGESIAMRNEGVDRDIAGFISAHLQDSPKLQNWSAHYDHIREALTAGAKGSFRWVECQFISLAKSRSESALKKSLASLPRSLDETYERMLLSIDPDLAKEAKRILTLLCYAERPLTMKEVIDGNSVELGDDPKFVKENRLADENDILQICPGFIEVNSNSEPIYLEYSPQQIQEPTLHIAHFSIQEYLESGRILQPQLASFNMSYNQGHADIAQISLIYLLDTITLAENITEAILNSRPFATYAARNWHTHYRQSEIAPSQIEDFVIKLFKISKSYFQNWIIIDDPENLYQLPSSRLRPHQVQSPVYYASLLGLHSIVFTLLEAKNIDVNALGGRYGSALQAASLQGYESVVQLLLDRGADVNAQGSKYNGSALQAASLQGYESVVQLLLDRGADVKAQGSEYNGSALQAASLEGYESIVQLLLDRGADVNAQGGFYGNALQAASFGGHESIVQLLLDRGADVNAQGGLYSNALQAAYLEGHESIVQLLLDRGADVNAQGGSYGNVLQAASLGGHESIVQLLLDRGADVNAQGGFYGNALQAASFRGHESIVQLLLDRGADVNAQCGPYGNVLQAASSGGHESIVQLLFDRGADVNAQGGSYGNVLQAASLGGHESIVQLLLDRGADVNAQGGFYGNALQAASFGGHESIVQLLLDRGADVNAQCGPYGNVLQAASFGGHESIVQLLLDRSARCGDSGEAIQTASKHVIFQ